MQIGMLVHSDYEHDNRVRREAETLVQAGYQVVVIAAASNPKNTVTEFNGVQIHYVEPIFNSGKLHFIEIMFRMYHRLNALNVDIVHAHDLDTLWPAARYTNRHKIPLIYDSHEWYLESISLYNRPFTRWIWSILENKLIHKAQKVITVCDGIADELFKEYALHDQPVVLRNIAEKKISTIAQNDQHPAFKKLRDLRNHFNFVGIYAGYLQKGRGIELLLQSLKDNRDWCFFICGQGPGMKTFKNRAQELNLRNRVKFTGNLDHEVLFPLISRCDVGYCFIEPLAKSYYYALPNKLTEYLQAGIPVIGSDLPEIRKIIEKYQFGFIAHDKEDLQTILNSFQKLKNDKFIEKHIKEAQDVLNWEQEKIKLLNLYQVLCRKHKNITTDISGE